MPNALLIIEYKWRLNQTKIILFAPQAHICGANSFKDQNCVSCSHSPTLDCNFWNLGSRDCNFWNLQSCMWLQLSTFCSHNLKCDCKMLKVAVMIRDVTAKCWKLQSWFKMWLQISQICGQISPKIKVTWLHFLKKCSHFLKIYHLIYDFLRSHFEFCSHIFKICSHVTAICWKLVTFRIMTSTFKILQTNFELWLQNVKMLR